MTVNFVCRGNAFRSRIAEAYFNSLQISGKLAVSSGTVADLHSQSNKHNFDITSSVLIEHGLGKYIKKHWTQLNEKLLSKAELTVFLNRRVEEECKELFDLPNSIIVWDVPDYDEITPMPNTDDEIRNYVDKTYQTIVLNVDNLVKNL